MNAAIKAKTPPRSSALSINGSWGRSWCRMEKRPDLVMDRVFCGLVGGEEVLLLPFPAQVSVRCTDCLVVCCLQGGEAPMKAALKRVPLTWGGDSGSCAWTSITFWQGSMSFFKTAESTLRGRGGKAPVSLTGKPLYGGLHLPSGILRKRNSQTLGAGGGR